MIIPLKRPNVEFGLLRCARAYCTRPCFSVVLSELSVEAYVLFFPRSSAVLCVCFYDPVSAVHLTIETPVFRKYRVETVVRLSAFGLDNGKLRTRPV